MLEIKRDWKWQQKKRPFCYFSYTHIRLFPSVRVINKGRRSISVNKRNLLNVREKKIEKRKKWAIWLQQKSGGRKSHACRYNIKRNWLIAIQYNAYVEKKNDQIWRFYER